MTANRTADETEQTMSADILQRAREAGAIDAIELSDLFSVSRSAGYDYFGRTGLSYAQFRTLFRRAANDEVRDLFLIDLLPGTGYIVQRIDASLDVDGDGDVDTDDAMTSGIDAMADCAQVVKAMRDATSGRALSRADADDLLAALQELVSQAVTTINIVSYLGDQAGRRRKAIQRPLGLGGRR